MKLLRLFCLILVSYIYTLTPSFGQDQAGIADSLVQSLNMARPDTQQVQTLIQLGKEFYQTDPKKARFYANKAVEMAQKLNYPKGLSKGYDILGVVNWIQADYTQAHSYFSRSLAIKKRLGDLPEIGKAYNNVGLVLLSQGQYSESLRFLIQALETHEKIHNKISIADVSENIGIIYQELQNLDQATEYYQKSLDIRKELGDYRGLAETYNNLGAVTFDNGKIELAKKYYFASLEITKDHNNPSVRASSYNNLGLLYKTLGDLEQAAKYYQKALEIDEEIGDKYGVANTLSKMGYLYATTYKTEEALAALTKSLEIAQSYQYEDIELEVCGKLTDLYEKEGNFAKALTYFRQFKELSDKLLGEETQKQIAELQTKYESEKKEKENQLLQARIEKQNLTARQIRLEAERQLERNLLLEAKNELNERTISQQKADSKRIIAENKQKEAENLVLKQEKRLKESQLKEKEARIQRQNIITFTISISLLMVMALSIVLYRANQQKQKANQLLHEKNEFINHQNEEILEQSAAIEAQKNEIQRKSQAITESIVYAKRIQEAILPFKEQISQYLNEYFILFQPRDIVSGDFYWFEEVEGKLVFAIVDCIGHGVPGAFMSMIGNDLLNNIVYGQRETNPDVILEKMHKGIRHALKQDQTRNQDGMDAAILIIDPEKRKLSYAGAKNPLIFIQDDQLNLIKGDRYGVGGSLLARERTYHAHTLDLPAHKPSTFYIFSDGYADQFGGDKGRKFMTKRFRKLLLDIHNLPMEEQRATLQQKLQDWQGDNSQIDDILILGIRY